MSLDATKWAWGRVAEDDLAPAEALVLLRVADHASRQKDGRFSCWPGVEQLAESTGRGEKTVRRALSGLEDAGLLRRERRSSGSGSGSGRSADLLVLPVEGSFNRSDCPVEGDDSTGHPDRENGDSTGHPDQFNRSSSPVQPVILSSSTGHLGPAIYREPEREPEKEPESEPRVRVRGREVTDQEHATVGVIVRAFASLAQQRFDPDTWTDAIVHCLRGPYDLTEADHLAIIAAAFQDPWWTDEPTPGVVYANRRQFERSLAQWRGGTSPKSGRKRKPGKLSPGERDQQAKEQRRQDEAWAREHFPTEPLADVLGIITRVQLAKKPVEVGIVGEWLQAKRMASEGRVAA